VRRARKVRLDQLVQQVQHRLSLGQLVLRVQLALQALPALLNLMIFQTSRLQDQQTVKFFAITAVNGSTTISRL
jgi:hypothetical protein